MRHYYLTAVLLTLVFSCGSALGESGIPYVGWVAANLEGEASLAIFTDGSGLPLTQATDGNGQFVDATIEIQLVDSNWAPVPDFPFEDIWLDTEIDGCTACANVPHWGFMFDVNTDENGIAYISGAPAGGGWTEGPVWVYLNGSRAHSPDFIEKPPVPLHFNSPDINNDGEVNLADVSTFAENYFGQYHYRSDFHWDGVVNLADVGLLASGLGTSCE